jgi:hypothetical protein
MKARLVVIRSERETEDLEWCIKHIATRKRSHYASAITPSQCGFAQTSAMGLCNDRAPLEISQPDKVSMIGEGDILSSDKSGGNYRVNDMDVSV